MRQSHVAVKTVAMKLDLDIRTTIGTIAEARQRPSPISSKNSTSDQDVLKKYFQQPRLLMRSIAGLI